jgi:2-polyprenyl-3-methyl-5-hydroxy-6-metoxy-1,4-benzoquinol methylase
MNRLERIRQIYADEGITGLAYRVLRRAVHSRKHRQRLRRDLERQQREEAARHRAQRNHERRVSEFAVRSAALGIPDLQHFYWYHTIDLGDGLVTPGDYDYRQSVSAFQLPDDMTGMRVLDVGSATGFFAFECERRGAQVVSVELPSLAAWDMIPAEREMVFRLLMQTHDCRTIEEMDHRHLHGPFTFCHQRLRSNVKRCYGRVYDLSADVLGCQEFDWVILGDLLVHLMSPFEALCAIAPLCRGTLVVTADRIPVSRKQPLSYFCGTQSKTTDMRAWWKLNQRCLKEMLNRVGFQTVSVVGRYRGIVARVWSRFDRYVIHAAKG